MEETGQTATAEPVVGERQPMDKRAIAVALVVLGVATAWSVWRQQYAALAVLTFFAIRGALLGLKPASVVSPAGILRPWRTRSVIGWAEVHAVIAPRPGVRTTRLKLVNGKEVSVDDVPAARSADVAALGGKPIETAAPPARPAPRPVVPADRDATFDIDRRAAALSAEWRRMELDNMSRSRPSSGGAGAAGSGDR